MTFAKFINWLEIHLCGCTRCLGLAPLVCGTLFSNCEIRSNETIAWQVSWSRGSRGDELIARSSCSSLVGRCQWYDRVFTQDLCDVNCAPVMRFVALWLCHSLLPHLLNMGTNKFVYIFIAEALSHLAPAYIWFCSQISLRYSADHSWREYNANASSQWNCHFPFDFNFVLSPSGAHLQDRSVSDLQWYTNLSAKIVIFFL